MSVISRREAIKRAAILVGGTLAIPDILRAWESPDIPSVLSLKDEVLLGEVAETIVPTTDTPGAKAAGVPKFIQKIVGDCYEVSDRTAFYDGLSGIDVMARDRFAKSFVECNSEERTQVLRLLESADKQQSGGFRFWQHLKSLVVTGYFTSEIGCTEALRYEAIPGRYDGAMPYKKGDKTWAT
jgi:hypothetical protein